MNEPVYPYIDEQVCVVVHDAGAGNLILSEVRSWSPRSLSIAASGPSRSIAKKLFPEVEIETLSSAMIDATLVVTGTSYNCDAEHLARKAAKERQIYCIAGLDHWVNYKERFNFNGEYILPRQILVSDFAAKKKAVDCFPECKVREVENKYLSGILSEIGGIEKIEKKKNRQERMLYILEPLRGPWVERSKASAMTTAFELFLNKLVDVETGVKVRVRLHPSQTIEDVRDIAALTTALPGAEFSEGTSLAEDIAWSTSVIGCESYALFVALCADRPVFSSLPPNAPGLRLPFPQIQELRLIQDKVP